MSSHCQAIYSLSLNDYFLFIPNAVELFSSNFTFFSVFDIPADLGEKDGKFSQKGLEAWNDVLNYSWSQNST